MKARKAEGMPFACRGMSPGLMSGRRDRLQQNGKSESLVVSEPKYSGPFKSCVFLGAPVFQVNLDESGEKQPSRRCRSRNLD